MFISQVVTPPAETSPNLPLVTQADPFSKGHQGSALGRLHMTPSGQPKIFLIGVSAISELWLW